LIPAECLRISKEVIAVVAIFVTQMKENPSCGEVTMVIYWEMLCAGRADPPMPTGCARGSAALGLSAGDLTRFLYTHESGKKRK